MPTARRIDQHVELTRGADEVWAALVDWEGQCHWVFASTVAVTGGDGVGVGATITARTGWGPLRLVDPMEITAWDPPRRVELRHTGRIVRGDVTFEVNDLGAGRSRLRWSEILEPPVAALTALYAVGTPLFALMVRRSLGRFVSWVEERPVSPS